MTIHIPQPVGMEHRNWHEWHLEHPYVKKQWHDHMTPEQYQAALKHGFTGWVDKTQAEHDSIIAKKKFGKAADEMHTKVFNEAATRAYADAVKQALTGATAIQLKWQSTNKGNALAKKDQAAGNTMDFAEHTGAAHGYALAAKHLKQIVEPGKGPIGQHALPTGPSVASTVTPENLPGLDDAGLKAIIANSANDAALIAKAQEILDAREATKAAQALAQTAQDGGAAHPATVSGPPQPPDFAVHQSGTMPSNQAQLDAMTKVSGNLGSNGGQWYKDASGQKYLVKPGKSDDHIYNEVAVNAVYAAAGAPVKDTGVVNMGPGQKVKVVGKSIDPLAGWTTTPENQAKAREFFGLDALTSNYDALGLVDDNAHLDAAGNVVRVDNGGGGFFRAQGAPKPGFKVGAWDKAGANPDYKSLRDPSINGQTRFYGAPVGTHDAEIAQSLANAATLDLGVVATRLDAAGVPEPFQKKFLAVLKDRQDHLKKLPEVKAILEPSTPTPEPSVDVPAPDLSKIDPMPAADLSDLIPVPTVPQQPVPTVSTPTSVSPAPMNVVPKSQVSVGDKVSFTSTSLLTGTKELVGTPDEPVEVIANKQTGVNDSLIIADPNHKDITHTYLLASNHPINVHVPVGTPEAEQPEAEPEPSLIKIAGVTLSQNDAIKLKQALMGHSDSSGVPLNTVNTEAAKVGVKDAVTGSYPDSDQWHGQIPQTNGDSDKQFLDELTQKLTDAGVAPDAVPDFPASMSPATEGNIKVGDVELTKADALKLKDAMEYGGGKTGNPTSTVGTYSTEYGVWDANTMQPISTSQWQGKIPYTGKGDSDKQFLLELTAQIKGSKIPSNIPATVSVPEGTPVHVSQVQAKDLKPGDKVTTVGTVGTGLPNGTPDHPLTVSFVGEKDEDGDIPIHLTKENGAEFNFFPKPGTKVLVHNATTGPVYDIEAEQAKADAAQAVKDASAQMEHASPQSMKSYYEDHAPEVGSKTVTESSGVGRVAELVAYASGRKWAVDHPTEMASGPIVKKFAQSHNKAINASNLTTAANMRGIIDQWDQNHLPENPDAIPPMQNIPLPPQYQDFTPEQKTAWDAAVASVENVLTVKVVPKVQESAAVDPEGSASSMVKAIQNSYNRNNNSYLTKAQNLPAADLTEENVKKLGTAWALRRRGAHVPTLLGGSPQAPILLGQVSNGHVLVPPIPGEKTGTVIKTIGNIGGPYGSQKKVKVQSDAGVTVTKFLNNTPLTAIVVHHQKFVAPAIPALKPPPVPNYAKSVELAQPVKGDTAFDHYMSYKEAKYPHYVQGYLEGKAEAEDGGPNALALKAQAKKEWDASPNSHAGIRAHGRYAGISQALADKEREPSLLNTAEKVYSGEAKFNPPAVDEHYISPPPTPMPVIPQRLVAEGFMNGGHPQVSMKASYGEQDSLGTPDAPVTLLKWEKTGYSEYKYETSTGVEGTMKYPEDVIWYNPPNLNQPNMQYKVGYSLGKETALSAQGSDAAMQAAHDRLVQALADAKPGSIKADKAQGKLDGYESSQESIANFHTLVAGNEKTDVKWTGNSTDWTPQNEAYAKGYITTKNELNKPTVHDEYLKSQAVVIGADDAGSGPELSAKNGKLAAIKQIQYERAQRATLLAAGNQAEADKEDHFAAPASEPDEYKIAYARAKAKGIGQDAESNQLVMDTEQAKVDAAPEGSKEKAIALGNVHGTAQSNDLVKKADEFAAEFAGEAKFSPSYGDTKVPYILGYKEASTAADAPNADLDFLNAKYKKDFQDSPYGTPSEAVGKGGWHAIQQAMNDKAEREQFLELSKASEGDTHWNPPTEHTDEYKIGYVKGNKTAISNTAADADTLVATAKESLHKLEPGSLEYVKAQGKLHGMEQGAEEVHGAEAMSAEFAGEAKFKPDGVGPQYKVPYIIGYKKAHDEAIAPSVTDEQLSAMQQKWQKLSNDNYNNADEKMGTAGVHAVQQVRSDKAKREQYLAQAELAKNDALFQPPTEHTDEYKIGYVKGKQAGYNENAQAGYKAMADQKLAEAQPGTPEHAAALGTVHGAEQAIKNTAAADEFKADEFYAPPSGEKVHYNGGYAEGKQATAKMTDAEAIKYKNDAYEIYSNTTEPSEEHEANGRMDGAFQTLADRGLAGGSATSTSTDFHEKFQKSGKLTNKGLKEVIPQKYLITEPGLMKLDAYRVGKFNGTKAAGEITDLKELEDNRDSALAKSGGSVSASSQAAYLGVSHAYQAATEAHAKPKAEEEAQAIAEPVPQIPVDPKTLPEYQQATDAAAALRATGVSSRDLYKKAAEFDPEVSPEAHAQHLAWQDAAEALDFQENEKPEVNILPGSAPAMTPEAIELMKAKALPAKDPNAVKPLGTPSPAPLDEDLAHWAYDQGRVLGLAAAQTATTGETPATAADLEQQALVHEDIATQTVGLDQRKHQGIAKVLHRYAAAMHAGESAPTTGKSEGPKPNVLPPPKQVVPTVSVDAGGDGSDTSKAVSSGVSGYPKIEVSFTDTEKQAIASWTGAYRWAGSGNSDLVKAINLLMAGKDVKNAGLNEQRVKWAKIMLDICNTKSVPSKQTIYRKTGGAEFAPGQLAQMEQQLAAGKEVTLSEPLVSHTYTSGVWYGNHQYIIDAGAMTCDIGPYGGHPGEVETVTGGLFQVSKITHEGGMTKIYMKQIEHYAN